MTGSSEKSNNLSPVLFLGEILPSDPSASTMENLEKVFVCFITMVVIKVCQGSGRVKDRIEDEGVSFVVLVFVGGVYSNGSGSLEGSPSHSYFIEEVS